MSTLSKLNTWLHQLSTSVFDRSTTDFWLQQINPLWSSTEARGQIVARHQIAQDMYQLKIKCNRQMEFGEAGQHHPVFVEINGIRYERSYSLTQLDRQHIALNVKHVHGGLVSGWLCEKANIGDYLRFGKPYGEVSQDHFQSKSLVLLVAGSGITPAFSILHALEKQNRLEEFQIHLKYWASTQREHAFILPFKQWQERYASFNVDFYSTQAQNNTDNNGTTSQRLNATHLQSIQDVHDCAVFACGPSGFVETAQSLCRNAKQFQGEAFYFSTPSVTTSDSSEIELINIHLSRSNKQLQIPKGQSILTALEAHNIRPQHGCRMGICNKCACPKVSGSTQHIANKQTNHEANQLLRICVNSAQSDITLAL